MSEKLPAFQFYTGDWLKDPSLRSVSYSARGLWTDMLCLMHESDRRGHLQLNDKPVSLEQLARMTGGSTDEVSRLLQELENSGVFSRTGQGTIFSRRMVKDEKLRQTRKKAGSLGGNPNLVNQKSNQTPTTQVNQIPTPSSSASATFSSSLRTRKSRPEADPRVKPLQDYFYAGHLKATGVKPILDGKSGELAKKLLATYGDLEKLNGWIDEFFAAYEAGDEFSARTAGTSFGVFYSQVQRLATTKRRAEDDPISSQYARQVKFRDEEAPHVDA